MGYSKWKYLNSGQASLEELSRADFNTAKCFTASGDNGCKSGLVEVVFDDIQRRLIEEIKDAEYVYGAVRLHDLEED